MTNVTRCAECGGDKPELLYLNHYSDRYTHPSCATPADTGGPCVICWKPAQSGGWYRVDDGDEGQEFFCSEECYSETQPD